MPTRQSRISAFFRRFAGRERLTRHSAFREPAGGHRRELRNGQFNPYNSTVLWGMAVDVLTFEFLGLAMLALCIIVLAVPSRRPPGRHVSDY
jgi:hypothetical protein